MLGIFLAGHVLGALAVRDELFRREEAKLVTGARALLLSSSPDEEEFRAYMYIAVAAAMLIVALGIHYGKAEDAEDYETSLVPNDKDDDARPQPDAAQHGETEAWSLKFVDPGLENSWQAKEHPKRIRSGARLLVGSLTGISLLWAVLQIDRATCKSSINWENNFEMVGSIIVLFLALLYCMKYPADNTYWPILTMATILMFWFWNPPFKKSCQELFVYVSMCPDNKHWWLAARKMDCLTNGHTAEMAITLWILLLPYLIPGFLAMPIAWLAMPGMFCVFTVKNAVFDGEMFYHGGEDISMHLVLLGISLCIATSKKYVLERAQRAQFMTDVEQRKMSGKLYEIFEGMVPHHVVRPMLENPGKVIAEPVECVTILFILITDFDKFASTMSPGELLKFLNTYFSLMDDICLKNGVTKIETVGEEYVCCVGVTPADIKETAQRGHGAIIERMFKAADEILQLQDDQVQFKMGMHTGPIVAGVIGQKLPRYRLVGDTINTAARMMQKCLPGQLQFGEETSLHVPESIPVTLRGEVEMKGKGKVTVYVFDRKAAPAPSTDSSGKRPVKQLSRQVTTAMLLHPERLEEEDEAVEGAAVDPEKASDLDAVIQGVAREAKMLASPADFFNPIPGFAPGMEEKWFSEFHTAACQGKQNACEWALIALSLVSLLELTHMWSIQVWKRPHHHLYFSGAMRMPVYLWCRLICCGLILVWQQAFARRVVQRWEPARIQWMMVTTCCAIVCCVFISYDALVIISRKLTNHEMKKISTINPQFSLIFSLTFFIVTNFFQLCFRQSLVFVPLGMLLMACRDMTHMYISEIGRVIFLLMSILSTILSFEMERSSRARFQAKAAVESTQGRIETILDTLMPPLLVKQLRAEPDGAELPTHEYRFATIAQSDLCGFTQLAATLKPYEVVEFIGELFGSFDVLSEKREVYKVETIGDAYIAGRAEKPLTAEESPVAVLLFGLDMVRATNAWAKKMRCSVRCRVGVHHGHCIGGIVGTGMMRYHLFGQFMAAVDTLEATSEEGVAQVSSACKELIEKELAKEGKTAIEVFGSDFIPRTEPHLKTSKGEVHEYTEVGGPTFLVHAKEDGAATGDGA